MGRKNDEDDLPPWDCRHPVCPKRQIPGASETCPLCGSARPDEDDTPPPSPRSLRKKSKRRSKRAEARRRERTKKEQERIDAAKAARKLAYAKAVEYKAPDYGSQKYWNERYESETFVPVGKTEREIVPYDWYADYKALKGTLHTYLKEKRSDRILMAGCGTSTLSEALWADGWMSVTNVDYSEVACNYMRKRNASREGMEYLVMDVRRMSALDSGTYDCVIDKGCIDALFCTIGSISDQLEEVCAEISRLLKPGGYFLCFTQGTPAMRMPYFQHKKYSWAVEHTSVVEAPEIKVFVMKKYRPKGALRRNRALRAKARQSFRLDGVDAETLRNTNVRGEEAGLLRFETSSRARSQELEHGGAPKGTWLARHPSAVATQFEAPKGVDAVKQRTHELLGEQSSRRLSAGHFEREDAQRRRRDHG